MARDGWSYGEHLHYMADISDMDCVSTADFEKLQLKVDLDIRNLDVAWIILCSEFSFSMQQNWMTRPA